MAKSTPSFEFTNGGIQEFVLFAMILVTIVNHYLIFAMLFMQLRGLLNFKRYLKLSFLEIFCNLISVLSLPVYFIASKCLIFSTLQELLTGSSAACSLPGSDNKMK